MNNEDKRAIYRELLDAIGEQMRDDFPQPNVTVEEYRALLAEDLREKGIEREVTRAVAYNALEKGVRDGKLDRASVKIGNRPKVIYWKV